MLSELLLPQDAAVQVDGYEMESHRLVLHVSSTKTTAICPYCETESMRINTHYSRQPADLPCAGAVVQLQMRVRSFFCDNAGCAYRTFAERFPELVAPYARRTERLLEQRAGTLGAALWASKQIAQNPKAKST